MLVEDGDRYRRGDVRPELMEALLGDGGGPRRLVQPLGEPGGAPSWVPERRPERSDRAVGSLDALAERITDAHRVPDPPEDVVSTLLEAVDADGIDERQVRDEVVTILLAGHGTTALVLTTRGSSSRRTTGTTVIPPARGKRARAGRRPTGSARRSTRSRDRPARRTSARCRTRRRW
ncbi:hypothetical protein BRC93_14820 [Halobacteriales archaeon QS_5_70_15]|nr:MAG: hypothetical protein BRC93_14820 [Halobacteriales archaeon QS_5_70_15]